MREAFVYTLYALLQLVVAAFLVRLLMQLVRADFRNPFAVAIVAVTNPLIRPLRKLLPPVGRLDTASVLALIAVQLASVAIVVFAANGVWPDPATLFKRSALELALNTTYVFTGAIIISVILSWVAQGQYNPIGAVFQSLSRPVLRPFQRIIPPLGGLDLSPVFALILLQALRILILESAR